MLTQAEMRAEAHARAERGTRCFQDGRCRLPNAYLYDKEIIPRVKTAILADKTIDAGAIDVDTYQDRKLVVLRGSVPTEAQKLKAGMIAKDNASSYTIDNQLAVVPKQ